MAFAFFSQFSTCINNFKMKHIGCGIDQLYPRYVQHDACPEVVRNHQTSWYSDLICLIAGLGDYVQSAYRDKLIHFVPDADSAAQAVITGEILHRNDDVDVVVQ